jgi:hypothetical protein
MRYALLELKALRAKANRHLTVVREVDGAVDSR